MSIGLIELSPPLSLSLSLRVPTVPVKNLNGSSPVHPAKLKLVGK